LNRYKENIVSTQRTEVLSRIKKVIVTQLDVEEDKVEEGAAFIDDLGADSLALVELVLAFEESFGVTIPDTEADKLRTVGDAVTYVLAHQSAPRGRSAAAP
jgi:acyl carrier protein